MILLRKWVPKKEAMVVISFLGLDVGKQDFVNLHVIKKGSDQPAHLHSLISAFVIHILEIIIANLLTCKSSTFKLAPET